MNLAASKMTEPPPAAKDEVNAFLFDEFDCV
jgi:hypothetical protein